MPMSAPPIDATQRLLQVHWEQARRHPYPFLERFVYTMDQHDLQHPTRIKPFPAYKPYIKSLTDLWLDNRFITVKKSRQMVMTWFFCALYTWDTIFHPGRLNFLQSKREPDAIGSETAGTGLLGRCKFILNHIPGGEVLLPKMVPLSNTVEFPEINSMLWAIPEGGDVIRTHTASGLFADEAAFQPEFAGAYMAAMPCLRGGGRFTAVSTPDPGFFINLHEDRLSEDM